MKRVAVIALLLCALFAGCVTAASGEAYAAPGVFSVRFDSDSYALDTAAYADENTNVTEYRWFFILYNDTYMLDASMTRIAAYDGWSLVTADAAAQQTYVDDTLDLYGDEGAALHSTMRAGSRQIPFYIFRCQDESGPYLMAETIVNGYAIDFMAYYNDSSLAVDDALARTLQELLDTFEPA